MSRSLPEDQDIDDPLDPPEAIPSSLARPAFLAPFGPSPWFKSLTYTLTRIRNISNRDKKVEVLASFIKKWKMYYGLDFYPAMRLFIPDRDKERAVYGIKEQALARVYCEILNLDPKTSDAGRRLMGWKQPTGQDHRVSGDFASVLYEVLKDRTAVSETRISVDEVNDLLDRLSQANTVEARKPIFAEFLKKLEAQDHEWLARIILKDLKISVREKFILDTFHPDAMALFNVCSDLKRVCYTLPDVTKRLPSDESAITLGRAIIPMLSARAIPDFVKTAKMMGPSFIIEEKIDGERMQIHKCGNEFRYWSRKGKDYTDHYGRYVNSDKASLTPWIADLFRADVADCILDGEMLAYDPESDRCLPFGSLKTAALNVGGEEDAPHPCFKVFDILFIRGTASAKGQSLARIPLWRRKVFLEGGFDKESQTTTEGVVREQKGRLEFPYRRNAASTADHIRLELDRVMDMKGEGLVLKQDDGLYHCGERAPAWTKIKPDYFDELGETFDLQVLGGYWGTGRRGGRVSSVLLGLRIDGEKDANGNDVYVTFAKAGGGFTLSDFQWMRDYHEDHWITFDRKKPLTWPTFIRFSDRGVEDKPDVWIKPEHSFVIEVKGSEIVDTVEFGLKQTIRFPRVKYIRYDLASKQKMNERENVNTEIYVNKEGLAISEWEELRSQSEQRRLDHRPGIDQMKRKRGSDVKKVQKKAKIPESFRGASVKDVELESQIFQLTTFYILQLVKVDGAPKPVKQYLEELVVEHGGDFTQKADLNEDAREEGRALFIVASELHLRTNAHVKKAAFDIVTPEWIVDSIAQGRALPLFEKSYLLFATERTKADAAYLADPDTFVDSEDESDYSGDEGGNDFHVGLGDDHEDGGDSGLDTATDGYEDEDEGIPDFPTASLPPRLGGTTGQINYNQNLIFQPLVIYLDTPDNSAENLLEDPDLDDIVITELKLYRAFIEAQGGVVTDRLDDPKLTHVVLATDDGERFGDISRRTSKPYRRQIVSLKWVKECLRQETLLAESGYRP